MAQSVDLFLMQNPRRGTRRFGGSTQAAARARRAPAPAAPAPAPAPKKARTTKPKTTKAIKTTKADGLLFSLLQAAPIRKDWLSTHYRGHADFEGVTRRIIANSDLLLFVDSLSLTDQKKFSHQPDIDLNQFIGSVFFDFKDPLDLTDEIISRGRIVGAFVSGKKLKHLFGRSKDPIYLALPPKIVDASSRGVELTTLKRLVTLTKADRIVLGPGAVMPVVLYRGGSIVAAMRSPFIRPSDFKQGDQVNDVLDQLKIQRNPRRGSRRFGGSTQAAARARRAPAPAAPAPAAAPKKTRARRVPAPAAPAPAAAPKKRRARRAPAPAAPVSAEVQETTSKSLYTPWLGGINKQFYDLMSQFEQDFKKMSVYGSSTKTKENFKHWPDHVYTDGKANQLFQAYLWGYWNGKGFTDTRSNPDLVESSVRIQIFATRNERARAFVESLPNGALKKALLTGLSKTMNALMGDVTIFDMPDYMATIRSILARQIPNKPKWSATRAQLLGFFDDRESNPSVKAIYQKFNGRPSRRSRNVAAPAGTPRDLAQLGRLRTIKTVDGRTWRFPGDRAPFLAADSRGKLHIVGGHYRANPAGEDCGEIDLIEYQTRKPHLGHHKETIYYHKLGEDTGERPTLEITPTGELVIHGGAYRIESDGIHN